MCEPTPKHYPIIGIVTQPNEDGWPGTQPYIAASYVKYVESAGARVVPINFDGSDEYLEQMYAQINGVLFPGGGQTLDGSALLHTATFFVNKSVQAYASGGDYFPVVGHCQGFEVMLMAITGLDLEKCMVREQNYRAENVSLPLHSLNFKSRWFANMSASVAKTLSSEACTINNHVWSTPVDLWNSLGTSTALNEYRVVSTTVSPAGFGMSFGVVVVVRFFLLFFSSHVLKSSFPITNTQRLRFTPCSFMQRSHNLNGPTRTLITRAVLFAPCNSSATF